MFSAGNTNFVNVSFSWRVTSTGRDITLLSRYNLGDFSETLEHAPEASFRPYRKKKKIYARNPLNHPYLPSQPTPSSPSANVSKCGITPALATPLKPALTKSNRALNFALAATMCCTYSSWRTGSTSLSSASSSPSESSESDSWFRRWMAGMSCMDCSLVSACVCE